MILVTFAFVFTLLFFLCFCKLFIFLSEKTKISKEFSSNILVLFIGFSLMVFLFITSEINNNIKLSDKQELLNAIANNEHIEVKEFNMNHVNIDKYTNELNVNIEFKDENEDIIQVNALIIDNIEENESSSIQYIKKEGLFYNEAIARLLINEKELLNKVIE